MTGPDRLGLPVVKVLPDGTYTSVLVHPKIRGTRHDRPATIRLHTIAPHAA